MDDSVRNPAQDLEHAHALLARMSPEELLKATYALEEIIEASPWFHQKMEEYVDTGYSLIDVPEEDEEIDEAENTAAAQGRRQLAEGKMVSMEEVLADHGLTLADLQSYGEQTEQTGTTSAA